jgi:glycosyltransferase involved in cell wall biosynthesis
MRLDLVIPAHNEQHRIDRTLRAYRAQIAPGTRVTVALDRCTDGTADAVRPHLADRRIRMFDFPKYGKGGVLMEAFRHCDAELVGFVDADCATPPREIGRLAEAAEDADGAIATRRHPAALLPAERPLARGVSSAGFAFGVQRLFGLPFSDTQCGAKVFRREVVAEALPLLSSRDFLFDVDLLLTARRLGYDIREVPTVWIDQEGSTVSAARDAKRMAASALRLWIHHRVLPVDRAARRGAQADRRSAEHRRRRGAQADRRSAEHRRFSSQGRLRSRPRSRRPRAGRAPDVALIAPYPPRGTRHAGPSGVASYASNLAHSLADAGARVTVIAPEERGEAHVSDDGPVRVERSIRRGVGALPAAARAARETGAEVAHLQHEVFLYGGPESVLGLAPALHSLRRGGMGPVVTMHHVVDPVSVDADFTRLHRVGVPPRVARRALGTVQQAIVRFAERVIVHEPAFARHVPGAAVIPHGLEAGSALARSQARARLGLNGRFTALCFGFVAPYKGLEAALEASRLAGDEVDLVVAGGDHPRLGQGYAEDLRTRFPGAARFTGHVPERDVEPWFSAADVALYLYPQPFAASGALALALAYGTPPLLSAPLAATMGAAEELVGPGEPDALAERLRELAGDPLRLESLRGQAAVLASERSWGQVARRHLDLYGEVSDADRAPGRRLRAA